MAYRSINALLGYVGLRIVRQGTLEKLIENSGSAIGLGGQLDESELALIGELREIEAQFTKERLADARSQARRAQADCHRLANDLVAEQRRSQELSGRLERFASVEGKGASNGRDHYAGRQDSMPANPDSLKSERDSELSLS